MTLNVTYCYIKGSDTEACIFKEVLSQKITNLHKSYNFCLWKKCAENMKKCERK